MQYSQSSEKAREISQKVLKRIEDDMLMAVPEIYELWYVYYAELNPEVARAIEIMEQSDQDITNERCFEIHQRFISDANENEKVKQAGDQIQQTIKSVGGIVTSVQSATAGYNAALEKASEDLSGDIDIEQARAALNDVVSTTRTMIQENSRLEAELSKSTSVMDELKRDLELVRKQALTDGLTNISNRKAFDDELSRVSKDAEAAGTSFCLILMDIDHFKGFNDTYGHQVGDQVLRLVAKTLFDGVKGRDMVARYGGEEFSILLPETSLESAEKLANSLREAVANKEVVNRNTGITLGRITLSGGVSIFEAGDVVSDIVERADLALYNAKHSGRNRISSTAIERTHKIVS